jgi:hypothetical protein
MLGGASSPQIIEIVVFIRCAWIEYWLFKVIYDAELLAVCIEWCLALPFIGRLSLAFPYNVTGRISSKKISPLRSTCRRDVLLVREITDKDTEHK